MNDDVTFGFLETFLSTEKRSILCLAESVQSWSLIYGEDYIKTESRQSRW